MRKLLDTTFLVHYLTREQEVEPYLSEHDDPGTEFLVSTISLKELAVGLHRIEAEPTVADLRADLGWTTILPFSPVHAFHAGRIEEHLGCQGMSQDRLDSLGGDVLIGGVALAEDASVVTRNVDDFELLPDVRVETY